MKVRVKDVYIMDSLFSSKYTVTGRALINGMWRVFEAKASNRIPVIQVIQEHLNEKYKLRLNSHRWLNSSS